MDLLEGTSRLDARLDVTQTFAPSFARAAVGGEKGARATRLDARSELWSPTRWFLKQWFLKQWLKKVVKILKSK